MRFLIFSILLTIGFSAQAEVVFSPYNKFPEAVRTKIVDELHKRCSAIITVNILEEKDNKIATEDVGGYQNIYYAILLKYDGIQGRHGIPVGARGTHFSEQSLQIIVKQNAFALDESGLEIFDIQSSEGVCLYDPSAEN